MDLHKKFIVAAVVDPDGKTAEQRFSRTQADLLMLKDWVGYHGCEVVACESTSDYWVQVYDLFAGQIPVIDGNAWDIKALSHKKTDKIDAAWIAKLALHDLIPASRVPDREQRDLRSLCHRRCKSVHLRTLKPFYRSRINRRRDITSGNPLWCLIRFFKTEKETCFTITICSHPVMKAEEIQGSKGLRQELPCCTIPQGFPHGSSCVSFAQATAATSML